MTGSNKSWILTDTEKQVWADGIELGPDELGVPGASVRKKTLHGGLADGVDFIEINNGALSFSVLPTRGMNIWKAEYGGVTVGWRAPVRGPVNPRHVNLEAQGGLGWLAGFDEMMCRCGIGYNGSPGPDVVTDNMGNPMELQLGLHGRISNIPAHYVEVKVLDGDPPEIAVIGLVDESMLFYPALRLATEIRTKAGSNALTINDEIMNINRRARETEAQVLYHCNFSQPFLQEGSRLYVPVAEVVPRNAHAAKDIASWTRYKRPTDGFVEQCYFATPLGDDNGKTLALLVDTDSARGVAVRFDATQLKCFTLWKNTSSLDDGYVTGLEPGTNYPNSRGFERKHGRVAGLAQGREFRAEVAIEICGSSDAVGKAIDEVRAIQGDREPKLHRQPHTDYCEA